MNYSAKRKTNGVKVCRRQLRLQIETKLIPSCPPVPSGDWGVICIDPPWHYHLRDKDDSHRGRITYPSMTDDQIKELPIREVAADDAYIFLWTTSNHLELSFECLRCWGFEFTGGVMVWLKATKKTTSLPLIEVTPHIGTGHYVRNCHEYVLIGKRGKVLAMSNYGITNVPSVIVEPKTRQHSRKPQRFYEIAEQLRQAIGCQAIDLFARDQRVKSPDWSIWGAESQQSIS
jgi:N6-adenosine-specific RNA methylase IME4